MAYMTFYKDWVGDILIKFQICLGDEVRLSRHYHSTDLENFCAAWNSTINNV